MQRFRQRSKAGRLPEAGCAADATYRILSAKMQLYMIHNEETNWQNGARSVVADYS